MIELQIDGRPLTAHSGETVLAVARRAGIEIPTLCHHPDLAPIGSCRMCLVEETRTGRTAAACTLPAAAGMVIRSQSPALEHDRRFTLKMLLASYVHDPATDRLPNELLALARRYGADADFVPAERFSPDSDPSPVIRVNLNQCIQCLRCVRACNEIQARHVWNLAERGHETHIVAGTGQTMREARCESCGACAAYCPTGALADRHALGTSPPDRLVTTTCAYCGVGCQFDLNVQAGRVVRVTSNPAAPVNGMSLCVKGRYGFEYLHHPDRLQRPRVRQAHLSRPGTCTPQEAKQSPWVEVDWATALDFVASRFAEIRQTSGPGAIGLLSSAKCTNEENYVLQKLARQVLGTHNIDHCARLCHSSTVAGLAMAYGSGAMSNSMDDVAQQAAAMFVIGSNTTEQHPVFGTMIRRAVQSRGLPLVVADPRKIDLVEFAALHLRQRPGTDVALINGLAHLILARGWHDAAFIRERCEAFEPFAESLAEYTPEHVARVTGVSTDQLTQAAEILGTNRPLAVVWAMGITQHTTGVLNVLALANLQMLLGNLGVPGGGVNPLRGQNNVQGACDMGALPNVFPGYQPVTSPEAAAKLHTAWALGGAGNSPSAAALFSNSPGLTVTEMINAGQQGQIRGLFILGEDPAMSEPDTNHARAALAATEFVVLQEILDSETAAYADVLLPGAAFAEKDGTYTNTERRVQLVRKAIDPPGEARQDWQITADLARRILARLDLAPIGPQAAWDYASPAQIMQEIAALTPSYAGISHDRLARGERLQWPVPHASHPGTPILHVGQFTRGRGKFHVVDHLPPHESPDEAYPLLLTTGRVLYHWHGGELSRRSPALVAECSQPEVEISPEDARRWKVAAGGEVLVQSRRGQLRAVASVTDRVPAGVVFGNFHFPGAGNVNNLTIAALDPIAKIPEYKVCAVRLQAAAPASPSPPGRGPG